MKLFENYSTKYIIISGGTPAEVFAGKELKDFLYQSTSVNFPLTEVFTEKLKKPIFSIGNTKLLQNSKKKDLLKDVKDDGYVMFVEEDTFFLSGKTPRGTLNGVYGFLQKFCGVRFFSEVETYVPELKTLEFEDDFYMLDNPSFSSRTFFTGIGVRNPVFNARSRMSCPYVCGGNQDYLGGNFNDWECSSPHTYLDYVPYKKYAEKHPEWFSTSNERDAWICLTNGVNEDGTLDESMEESVVKTVIEELKRRIISNKVAKYFVIGQTDDDTNCQCDRCKASYARLDNGYWYENRGIQETILVFINCIAREIKKWLKTYDPNREVYIVSLAYRGTLHPPVFKDKFGKFKPISPLVVPEDNVKILYCASGGCQTHKLGNKHCLKATRTNEDLLGWSALGASLMVYDYSTNFSNVLWYYPYLKTLSDKLKKYKDYGVEAIYTQALHLEGKNFDTLLQQYLYSQLFWNIDLDLKALLEEFYDKYFHKEISPYVKRDFEIMESAIYDVDTNINAKIHSGVGFEENNLLYSRQVFTKDVLIEAIATIESAITKVSELPLSDGEKNKLIIKLTSILIQPEMMLLSRYKSYFETNNGERALREKFFEDIQKVGIIYFSESKKNIGEMMQMEDIEQYLNVNID